MKKLIYTAICASLMFGLSSCQNDESSANEGAITIAANIDDSPIVRSAETDTELKNNAKVNIYLPSYGGRIRQYTYSDMPEIIYLPAGNGYRVDVEAGESVADNPTIASFDSKSYKGSASFNVTAGVVNTTPIVVEAKICNAITNVTFGEGVEEAFNDGYQLSIGHDSNNLVYTASNAGTDGYFIIADDALDPTLDWTFTGTLAKSGESFTKSGSFPVEQGKKYLMNVVYTEHNGVLKVIIRLDTSTNDKDDTIIFEPLSTGIEKTRNHEIWATHTTLHAIVDLETYNEEKVYFEYRKVGSADAWTKTVATTKVSDNGDFSLLVSGLEPEAKYEYQLVLTPIDTTKPEERIVSEPINTITMKAAPKILNASFEERFTHSSGYDQFYSQSLDKSNWWDCGNQKQFGITVNVTTSSTDIPTPSSIAGSYEIQGGNTRSVRMKSEKNGIGSIVVLGAGNLYTGQYGGTDVSTMSGTVKFGRPFYGRPTAMRLYTKYKTGAIDMIKNQPSDITLVKGETKDRAQIKVVLGDWKYQTYGGDETSPVIANTAEPNKIVNFAKDGAARQAGDKDKGTIAYGTAIIDGAGDVTINGTKDSKTYSDYNNWNVLTIPIEYYDLNSIPTHIIVSFTASAWGDYMSGSTSSELFVDAVELIYDSNVVVAGK